jgi:hypothetical protein
MVVKRLAVPVFTAAVVDQVGLTPAVAASARSIEYVARTRIMMFYYKVQKLKATLLN